MSQSWTLTQPLAHNATSRRVSRDSCARVLGQLCCEQWQELFLAVVTYNSAVQNTHFF